MNFPELIKSITSEPWLITPGAAAGYLPAIGMLVKGQSFFHNNHEILSYKKPEATSAEVLARYSDDPEFESFSYYLHAITPNGKRVKVDSYSQLPSGSIAIVPVKGPLMASDQYCGQMGMNTIGAITTSAENSTRISKIIFDIDSPGGQVKGTQQLANIVKACNTETLALCTMACSAAYWIASACDKIAATAETVEFGSIGTMIEIINPQPFYEKEGFEFHTIRATKSTDKNEGYYQALEGNYESIINEVLDPMNTVFIDTVRQNRDPSENTLTGKTYLAKDAIKLGLADEFKSISQIIGEMPSGNSNPSITMSKKSIISRIFGNKSAEAEALLEESTTEDPAIEDTEALSQDLATSQARVAELEEQNAELVTQNATYEATIERLNTRVAALEALPAADHSKLVTTLKGDEMVETTLKGDALVKAIDAEFQKNI